MRSIIPPGYTEDPDQRRLLQQTAAVADLVPRSTDLGALLNAPFLGVVHQVVPFLSRMEFRLEVRCYSPNTNECRTEYHALGSRPEEVISVGLYRILLGMIRPTLK